MTRLERRYRALLRLLPRWYRAEREEEMVGTFLADRDDELDLEYAWPGWAEAGAVLALAVRTRLAGPGGAARAVAAGDAVRLVALIGLLAFSALELASIPVVAVNELRAQRLDGNDIGMVSPWSLLLQAASLAVVAAFALLLAGRRTAARWCAAVALLPGLVLLGSYPPETGTQWLHAIAARAPLWAVVACLFAGFHRDASPAVAVRPWVRAAVAGTVLALCWSWSPLLGARPSGVAAVVFAYDPASLLTVAVVAAGVAYLAAAHRRGQRGERLTAWPLALAACAALVLPERLRDLDRALEWSSRSGELTTALGEPSVLPPSLVPIAVAQLVLVLAVGVALVVAGAREYRRLPAPMEPGPPRRA